MNHTNLSLLIFAPIFSSLYVLKIQEINKLINRDYVETFYGLSLLDYYILFASGFFTGTMCIILNK